MIDRRLFGMGAFAALATGSALPANAQSWPKSPIRMVVPGGPGSGTDVIARLLSGGLTPALGQQVIVDNKSGASGIIAHEHVAQAPADGSTFILSATASLMVVPALTPTAKFRYTDFVPVASVLRTPYLVLVRDSDGMPATFAEFVAWLKKDNLTYSATGTGTMTHLTSELLLRKVGARANHIPYKGSGASLADLMGGQVHFTCESTTSALTFVRQKKLRALAVSASARLATLPNVPTLSELGLPDAEISVLAGVFARKGTPDAILRRLEMEIAKLLADPKVEAQFEALDTPMYKLPNAEFLKALEMEATRWDKRLKDLNIKIT